MMLYGPLTVWVLVSAFGPYDTVQGPSSKLLYVHVPTVWIAYLGYTLTFIYSLLYLINKNPKYDSRAEANAKSGVLFTASTLIAGSVWGKFTWGTWWVWGDARLNLTAILLLVHQQASILSQETVSSGDAPMSPDILTTLLISVLLVTLVHIFLAKKFRVNSDQIWDDYLNPKSRAKI